MEYDYRRDLTDKDCEAALEHSVYIKDWWAVCYFAKLIANRERFKRGLPPTEA